MSIIDRLTKKEELAVEYMVRFSLNQTDAFFKAYDCVDKRSAGAIATKVMRKESVKNRLAERRSERNKVLDENSVDFATQLKKELPIKEVVAILKEQIKSGDTRTVDSSIDKYLKIIGGYKESKGKLIGLFDKIDELD